MGVSNSPKEMAGKLHKLAVSIDKSNEDAVSAGALIVKTRVLGEVSKAVGSDLKMGTKKIGVGYKVTAERAEVRARGPMHWLESGVKPHAIVARGFGKARTTKKGGIGTNDFVSQAFGAGRKSVSFFGGTGRTYTKSGARALNLGGDDRVAYVRKAGRFPAKQSWSHGVKASERPVALVFRQVHAKGRAKVFGVG